MKLFVQIICGEKEVNIVGTAGYQVLQNNHMSNLIFTEIRILLLVKM